MHKISFVAPMDELKLYWKDASVAALLRHGCHKVIALNTAVRLASDLSGTILFPKVFWTCNELGSVSQRRPSHGISTGIEMDLTTKMLLED